MASSVLATLLAASCGGDELSPQERAAVDTVRQAAVALRQGDREAACELMAVRFELSQRGCGVFLRIVVVGMRRDLRMILGDPDVADVQVRSEGTATVVTSDPSREVTLILTDGGGWRITRIEPSSPATLPER